MSKPKLPISVVIVHYKTEKSTISLVKKLLSLTEVIVADNSQSLVNLSEVKALQKNPNFHLINNLANYGFAHSCNQGLFLSKQKYVLFLNSDLEISEQNLQELLSELIDKKLTAICPTLVNGDGLIDLNYRQSIPTFVSLLVRFSPIRFLLPVFSSSKMTLAGACLLADKDRLLSLGGFDERFFIWFEDSDLSQCFINNKANVLISDDVRVLHQGAESFKKQTTLWQKNVFFHSLRIYAYKHFPLWQAKFLDFYCKRFSNDDKYLPDPNLNSTYIYQAKNEDDARKFLEKKYKSFDFAKEELIVTLSPQSLDLRQKFPSAIFITENYDKALFFARKRARAKRVEILN